jgi:phosphate transport system substrate-binding protein
MRFVSMRQPLLLLACCALLTACGPRTDERLVLTGSSTLAPLMAEIGKRYEAGQPGVRIDVQTGGSSRGIRDAQAGLADIGLASRALSADEQVGLAVHRVADDGVCFLVHRDNPVTSLSDQQLRDIYTGVIRNWQAVGGRDAPITVINRAAGRSELELFSAYFGLRPELIRADLIVGDNQQGIKTLVGNPDAIVYMSVGTSEYDASQGVPIRLLPLGGVAASAANVAQGRYPMSRPLLLITAEQPRPAVRAFIAYAQSPAVHDLIQAQAFVPVR